jgi:hypothetical protein
MGDQCGVWPLRPGEGGRALQGKIVYALARPLGGSPQPGAHLAADGVPFSASSTQVQEATLDHSFRLHPEHAG